MQVGGLSRKFTVAATALALCSPTIATAATTAQAQSISPLIAVSVFGTQASAQAACSGIATAAAGAAAAAQGQANCVLPATDAPPPVVDAAPPPPVPTADYDIWPFLVGLAILAGVAAAIALTSDGDDNDRTFPPISPA